MSTGGLGAVDSKLEQQVTEQASLQRRPPPDEPDEAFPGGTATTDESIDTHDAFSHFSRGIGFEGEARFKVGNAIFRKLWVSAPSSTQGSDGLGPLYNSRSCQSCHLKDGRGHPPDGNFPQDTAESMFLRLSIPPETDEQRRLIAEHKVNSIDEPTYGAQLQETAVQGHDNEGHMHITYEELPIKLGDGSTVSLRRPTYSIADLKYGPLHPKTMLSPRVAPPMIGLGLIEAIPEEQIRAHADPDDKDGDGISGRANEVWSIVDNRLELGRFGWKAGVPSIRQQTGTAFAIDIGISNPVVLKPSGDCTPAQTFCLNAPNGNSARDGGVEVGAKLFDLVVFYAQNLAVPPRRDFTDAKVAERQGAVLCTRTARAATRPRSPPARWRASPSSATRRSGPTPTCCCTTWARASPTTAPKAWRTGASGARRRCGALASRGSSTATRCSCTTGARAVSRKPSSGTGARRRPHATALRR